MAGIDGIEPPLKESNSFVLPLDHIPISKQVLTVAQRVELFAARIELAYLRDNRYPLVEVKVRLQLTTYRLQGDCSTN